MTHLREQGGASQSLGKLGKEKQILKGERTQQKSTIPTGVLVFGRRRLHPTGRHAVLTCLARKDSPVLLSAPKPNHKEAQNHK